MLGQSGERMLKNGSDVVLEDLEYICSNLQEELSSMAGSKLMITGGAGFLGYYLVQTFLYWNKRVEERQQISVSVFDNYIRGMPQWLEALKTDKNLSLLKHDISMPLPHDIDDYNYIIHAASIASPTYYRIYPIETMDANVNGLRYLLEYCKGQRKKNRLFCGLLYYSTSEIYGDPTHENIPTPETYRGNVSCTGPRACYDESKRYGETLCVNFANVYDLPVKVARPFNNYGPGLKITDRRVIPDIARDILAGKDIILLSDGAPTRTFCYVADAIVGYCKILIHGRNGEAYNIGVEEPEISMLDLARRLTVIGHDLFNYQGKVQFQVSADKDYLVDNPNRRCPLIGKARSELGYSPSISLDEGLMRSLIWYRDHGRVEVGE